MEDEIHVREPSLPAFTTLKCTFFSSIKHDIQDGANAIFDFLPDTHTKFLRSQVYGTYQITKWRLKQKIIQIIPKEILQRILDAVNSGHLYPNRILLQPYRHRKNAASANPKTWELSITLNKYAPNNWYKSTVALAYLISSSGHKAALGILKEAVSSICCVHHVQYCANVTVKYARSFCTQLTHDTQRIVTVMFLHQLGLASLKALATRIRPMSNSVKTHGLKHKTPLNLSDWFTSNPMERTTYYLQPYAMEAMLTIVGLFTGSYDSKSDTVFENMCKLILMRFGLIKRPQQGNAKIIPTKHSRNCRILHPQSNRHRRMLAASHRWLRRLYKSLQTEDVRQVLRQLSKVVHIITSQLSLTPPTTVDGPGTVISSSDETNTYSLPDSNESQACDWKIIQQNKADTCKWTGRVKLAMQEWKRFLLYRYRSTTSVNSSQLESIHGISQVLSPILPYLQGISAAAQFFERQKTTRTYILSCTLYKFLLRQNPNFRIMASGPTNSTAHTEAPPTFRPIQSEIKPDSLSASSLSVDGIASGSCNYRSFWWYRLITNTASHLGSKAVAMMLCEQALQQDHWVRGAYEVLLRMKYRKFTREVRSNDVMTSPVRPSSSSYTIDHMQDTPPRLWTSLRLEGRILCSRYIPGKCALDDMVTMVSTKRAKFMGLDGLPCTVEQITLQVLMHVRSAPELLCATVNNKPGRASNIFAAQTKAQRRPFYGNPVIQKYHSSQNKGNTKQMEQLPTNDRKNAYVDTTLVFLPTTNLFQEASLYMIQQSKALMRLYKTVLSPDTSSHDANHSIRRSFSTDDREATPSLLRCNSPVVGRIGWRGIHAENSLWKTIFYLLCWNEIFDDIPGNTFTFPCSSLPLGFSTIEYFEERSERFGRRFDFLRTLCSCQICCVLQVSYQYHFGYHVPGMRLDLYSCPILCEILHALVSSVNGIHILVDILQYFASDFENASIGLPDLVVWEATERCPFCPFAVAGDALGVIRDGVLIEVPPQISKELWSYHIHSKLKAKWTWTGLQPVDSLKKIHLQEHNSDEKSFSDIWSYVKQQAPKRRHFMMVEVKDASSDQPLPQQLAWIERLSAAGADALVGICWVYVPK